MPAVKPSNTAVTLAADLDREWLVIGGGAKLALTDAGWTRPRSGSGSGRSGWGHTVCSGREAPAMTSDGSSQRGGDGR